MKAYLIITIIFFSLANLSIANDFKNKIESEIQVSNKKFGGPKSDFVLERIRSVSYTHLTLPTTPYV